MFYIFIGSILINYFIYLFIKSYENNFMPIQNYFVRNNVKYDGKFRSTFYRIYVEQPETFSCI
jgi:hypothetical protein